MLMAIFPRVLSCAVLAVAASLVTVGAWAQSDYPTRPIRIVAGPGPDIIARLFAPKFTEALGQPIVVEQRPGAGGIIATQAVATAPPDGYMVLMPTASWPVGTALGTMPFDLRKDLAPIGLAATAPFVLVVHPSVKANNLRELIALAKANPGKLNYASSGQGTTPHLAGELFKAMAGVDIVHVPFREANSAITAVMSGAVQMMFSIASVAKAQVAGGKVRAIAVTTLQPTRVVPGIPTLNQSGLPGYEARAWNGFAVPLATPEPIIAKLNAAVVRALDDPALQERLLQTGYDPAPKLSPKEFLAFIDDDTKKWVDLVKSRGIQAQ
jgi:tripartite-type tricarboxylate transporter receptor subunit TctC